MTPLNPIFNLFGRSPIHPLQTHMAKVAECVQGLTPFFAAVFANDWEQAKQEQVHIANLENMADELKRDLRINLPKSLFLPVSRTDILTIITLQDWIANKSKDIAGIIIGRHMEFPISIVKIYSAFLNRTLDAVTQAKKAINELHELFESGFHGNEIDIINAMIIELDAIEHDTDQQQIQIRSELFKLEQTLPPVHVMFLYKVMDWTGELADHAHSLGGQLQVLLAR